RAVTTLDRAVRIRDQHERSERKRRRVLPRVKEIDERDDVLRDDEADADDGDAKRGHARAHCACSAGATASLICASVSSPSIPLTIRPSRPMTIVVGKPTAA